VTEHRDPSGTARPIVASVVGVVSESAAVGLRARENIMLVRCISDTFMHVALFVQGRNLVYAIAKAPALNCVAMQLR
jgi:hypothetical protein